MDDDRANVIVHLDELDRLRQTEGMDWLPVRRALGVSSFGISAYVAADAGGELVPAHDETGASAAGHEELYVVVSGHAEFDLDGERHDAPAGTMVFVPRPQTRRSARATQAGTTVIAVGATPGQAFAVAPWEDNAVANDRSRRGDQNGAIAIALDALTRHPDNPGLLYNLACYESLAGRPDAALAYLRRAAEIAPDEVARWADGDTDLDAIRTLAGSPLAGASG